MKLLQLNTWSGRLFHQMMKFIEEQNPDILCLQEVMSCDEGIVNVTDNKFFCSLQAIQELHGYEHVFFSPIVTTSYLDKKVSYGNAIVSRLPLSDTRTVFINGSLNDPYDEATRFNTRNLQVAHMRTGNHTFTIANHHAYWRPDRWGDEVTVEKMALVRQELDKEPLPLIFSGDLNVVAESQAMRVFDGWLEDLTATHNIDTTLSVLGKVEGVACDHILVSPEVQVHNFLVADDLVSDHKAVLLEFDV